MNQHTRVEKNRAEFVNFFGPVLNALRALGNSGTPSEVTEQIAVDLSLSDDILNETTATGQLKFKNQVAWARFYLVKEGLIDSSSRGVWSLTEKGRNLYLDGDEAHKIFLKWVQIFSEKRRNAADKTGKNKNAERQKEPTTDLEGTPADFRQGHRQNILQILRNLPPKGFENFAKRLLRESGFTEVNVIGGSGDGGIDGYGRLQVNPLVSTRVLFQCKRYKDSVSASALRDFRGALAGRADIGIFITTGSFTKSAIEEATRDGVQPIELIDGERLVSLMEELRLGLKPIEAYEVDEGFFEEFDA